MRNTNSLIINDEDKSDDENEISTSKKKPKQNIEQIEQKPLLGIKEERKINYERELSPDCFNGIDNAPSSILQNILKIKPNEILDLLIKSRKSFFMKVKTEKIMTWQKKQIDQPLLEMSDNYKKIALQIFRNLLSYMKDRKSTKKPILHARKFLKLTLHSNQLIKDEAFLQIYKQINNNTNYESKIRGYKFLAIVSSCFVPSKNIYDIILNFLFFENDKEKTDISITNHIKFIFARLLKTNEKQRKIIPCTEELEYIENLKSISIPLYFFEGNQTNINIESYTTVKDLKKKMMEFLDFNIQKSIYYCIYEIGIIDEVTYEKYIDDSEIVCDILAYWKSEKLKAEKKNKKVDFQFYLKLLIYYPFEETDEETISLVYFQTLYDVISGKFNLNTNKIIKLAGLQLLNDYGNEREDAYNNLKQNYKKYIPSNKINLMTKSQWIEKIMQFYSIISSFPKKESKWNYLEEIKEDKLYQTQQFEAKFNFSKSGTNDDNITDDCIIGFKPDGIIILDSERNEIVFYKYEIIMNWGISNNQFIICISNNDNDIRKVCFFTTQTKVIQNILEIYCNMIAGKDIKEIQNIIQLNEKKFEKIDSGNKGFRNSFLKKDFNNNNFEKSKFDEIDNSNLNENLVPLQEGMNELV